MKFKIGDIVKVIPNKGGDDLSYTGALGIYTRQHHIKVIGRLPKDSYLYIGQEIYTADSFLELAKNQIVLDIIKDL